MAKRQKRYTDVSALAASTAEITGKKANIVFRDGRVSFAEIVAVKSDRLIIKNMRLKQSEITFAKISELIIDSKA